ncbi:MAG TPA: hypothetical protein PKC96_06950 [Bacilli bacterium]|nr:hypothetical protein [Bacilli bacterium]
MDFWQWLLLVVGVISLVLLAIFLYHPLRKYYYQKNTVRIFYRTVRKVTLYFDFYLINQMILKLDANSTANIDHIVFGDKYIYVIKDRYYSFSLKGSAADQMLISYQNKKGRSKKEVPIENPLMWNRLRIDKLALITGIDHDLFISVVLVNDDVNVDNVATTSKTEYIINRHDLYRLVQAIESRPVEPLNSEQLHAAVHDIDRINKRHDREKKK